MSNTLLIVIAIVAVVLIVAGLAMRSGPRVTTIETRRDGDDGEAS